MALFLIPNLVAFCEYRLFCSHSQQQCPNLFCASSKFHAKLNITIGLMDGESRGICDNKDTVQGGIWKEITWPTGMLIRIKTNRAGASIWTIVQSGIWNEVKGGNFCPDQDATMHFSDKTLQYDQVHSQDQIETGWQLDSVRLTRQHQHRRRVSQKQSSNFVHACWI